MTKRDIARYVSYWFLPHCCDTQSSNSSMKKGQRPYDLDDGDRLDISKHESDWSRKEDPQQLEQDDGNVEEVDQVLEEDDVVHVDDAHVAPSADEEILDDLELDAGSQ